jgi:hypothetical protein
MHAVMDDESKVSMIVNTLPRGRNERGNSHFLCYIPCIYKEKYPC